jgi:hypothetical protein
MEVTTIINEKIDFTENVKSLPFIQEIRKQGETYYSNFATFIHWMFRKQDNVYYNLPEKERAKRIDQEIFKEELSEQFYHDGNCVIFIGRMKSAIMSDAERFYQNTKNDLELLRDKLTSIPLEKEGYYEQEVPSQDGEATIKVKVKVMIDNSAEKLKAMDMAEKLFAFIDKLEIRIKKEDKDKKKKNDDVRLFDN